IVDVAVKVLTEHGHEGKSYTLTGPASISFHDVAAALSKALGKEVNYVNVPPEVAREAMISMGLPEWIADALGEYTTAFSEGYGDFTTDTVENITAQPARSYETFARDFAQVFGAAAPQTA
ncbi:MAG: SDR family NAD(P)-dependent oxidoreductase, partial [Dehalococcoidia bacterium]